MMFARFRYSDIKEIISWTPPELKGGYVCQYPNFHIGGFRKKRANWWYMVYAVYYGRNNIELVVVVNGIIE